MHLLALDDRRAWSFSLSAGHRHDAPEGRRLLQPMAFGLADSAGSCHRETCAKPYRRAQIRFHTPYPRASTHPTAAARRCFSRNTARPPPPPTSNGIRFEKSRSAPLRVFYNPLIDWDLFLFFGVFKKRGYVATFFLANYAVWNCFGRKVDGFENRGSEVDQILWQATDPPSDFGHS